LLYFYFLYGIFFVVVFSDLPHRYTNSQQPNRPTCPLFVVKASTTNRMRVAAVQVTLTVALFCVILTHTTVSVSAKKVLCCQHSLPGGKRTQSLLGYSVQDKGKCAAGITQETDLPASRDMNADACYAALGIPKPPPPTKEQIAASKKAMQPQTITFDKGSTIHINTSGKVLCCQHSLPGGKRTQSLLGYSVQDKGKCAAGITQETDLPASRDMNADACYAALGIPKPPPPTKEQIAASKKAMQPQTITFDKGSTIHINTSGKVLCCQHSLPGGKRTQSLLGYSVQDKGKCAAGITQETDLPASRDMHADACYAALGIPKPPPPTKEQIAANKKAMKPQTITLDPMVITGSVKK
jgi:hypothetical protein